MLFIRLLFTKGSFLIQWVVYGMCVIPVRWLRHKPSVINLIFVYKDEMTGKKASAAVHEILRYSNEYLDPYSIQLHTVAECTGVFYPHEIHAGAALNKAHAQNEQNSAAIKKRFHTGRALVVYITNHIPSAEKGVMTLGGYMGMSHYMMVSLYGHKETLVHEIGHAQGLLHSSDRGNLMCSGISRTGTSLTKWQLLLYRYGIFAGTK